MTHRRGDERRREVGSGSFDHGSNSHRGGVEVSGGDNRHDGGYNRRGEEDHHDDSRGTRPKEGSHDGREGGSENGSGRCEGPRLVATGLLVAIG